MVKVRDCLLLPHAQAALEKQLHACICQRFCASSEELHTGNMCEVCSYELAAANIVRRGHPDRNTPLLAVALPAVQLLL